MTIVLTHQLFSQIVFASQFSGRFSGPLSNCVAYSNQLAISSPRDSPIVSKSKTMAIFWLMHSTVVIMLVDSFRNDMDDLFDE